MRVAQSTAAELAELDVPRLADLYAELGTDFELSLDLNDPAAGEPVLDVAVAGAGAATGCGSARRRHRCSSSSSATRAPRRAPRPLARRQRVDGPLERHAARLAEPASTSVNMHHTDWTAGLVGLFHRFDVLAFAWDSQEVRHLRAAARRWTSTRSTPTTSTAWSRPSPSGRREADPVT